MIPSPYSDTWLAAELASRLRERIAYDPHRQRWLIYEHPVWREDVAEQRVLLALEVVYDLRDTLASATPALVKCVDRWQRAGAIQRVLEHARYLLVTPARMPASDWTLVSADGTLLELLPDGAWRARPTTAGDWQTRMLGAHYDPAASCPRWQQFLDQISASRPDWVAYVQRLVGYSLTPSTVEQKFVFCIGSGANGKSVLLSVLRALFGNYAADTPFQTFVTRRGTPTSHDDALMALEGARLVTAQEGAVRDALDDATIKRITGETVITGSRKYERTTAYKPEFTLWLAANSLPRVDDLTIAFWRRVVVLPFDMSFAGREDRGLEAALIAELPGILNWSLEGYRQWRLHGLNNPPPCVLETATTWQQQSNPLADWLSDCCIIDPAATSLLSVLYQSYRNHCAATGAHQIYSSPRQFWRALQQLGYDVYRSQSIRKVRGVRLL